MLKKILVGALLAVLAIGTSATTEAHHYYGGDCYGYERGCGCR